MAPAAGARWAERLWFTIPAGKPLPHHPGGQKFVTTVDGHEIAGTVWGSGPTVYLAHGWGGQRGQFTALVAPLLAAGLQVICFDMPSHASSAPGAFGPRSSSFPEFTAALHAVVERHGPPHALVAHSAGAIAAVAALCDGMPARRLVLVAPMAGVTDALRQFVTSMGGGQRTLRRLAARSERRVGAPLHHFDVIELGRAVAMPSTLIVHDRDDTFTPISDGAAIAAAWPGTRLHVTRGLGHNRILRDSAVTSLICDFVAKP